MSLVYFNEVIASAGGRRHSQRRRRRRSEYEAQPAGSRLRSRSR